MKRLFGFILVLLSFFLFSDGYLCAADGDDLFRITVIDVGKGDCILVETGGDVVMIDTGYKETAEDVLQYLEDHNITGLDALIISHYHKDHVGGGAAVLTAITPDRIYMPDYPGTRDVYLEMLDVIDKQGLSPERVKGDAGVITFTLDSGAEYRLYPSTVAYNANDENDNDVSMAAAVFYNGHSAFFAGDLEKKGIDALLKYANDDPDALKCDILKLPHHGRTSANSSSLLDLVDPKTALITDGSSQRAYGEMIDMLDERGIDYLCTAVDGTYVIMADDSGYTYERSKQADDKTSGPWKYTVLQDGTAAVTGYTGTDPHISIPSSIDGHRVSRIADSAFYNHKELTSVAVPAGVTEIGDAAFSWCTNLKEISVPDQITSLGSGAFSFCGKLEYVNIPAGITSIGEYTFFRCAALNGVKIPDQVTSIGEKAFSHCSSLETITIPPSVQILDEDAFAKCSSLKTLIIMPGLKTIRKTAFEECTSLESVWMPSSVETIKGNVFKNCSVLTDIYFDGTEEMWNAMDRAKSWDKGTPEKTIHFESPAPVSPEPPVPPVPPEDITPAPDVTPVPDVTPAPDNDPDHFPQWDPETVLPATGISSGLLPARPEDLNYKDLGLTIEIPSVSSAAKIVEVPLTGKDYPVTWLGEFAGSLEGFARPGKGTSVIVGHNHLDQQQAGPFLMLRFVRIGDRIFIRTDRGKIDTYIVFANVKISENDFDTLEELASVKENVLLLMTCEDERVDGGYENRRIIAAAL